MWRMVSCKQPLILSRLSGSETGPDSPYVVIPFPRVGGGTRCPAADPPYSDAGPPINVSEKGTAAGWH